MYANLNTCYKYKTRKITVVYVYNVCQGKMGVSSNQAADIRVLVCILVLVCISNHFSITQRSVF